MKMPIYLDYAATTPVDPRVVDKMLPYLTENFGNPSSSHSYGQTANKAVELARAHVAGLINAEPAEIIWTSGATEANNLGLKGAAELYQRKGKHIITMKTEHKAVLDSCQQLEKMGFVVTYLAPEKTGLLDLEKFKQALRPETILVSIMHMNNETGVIQNIEEIAKITSANEILFHVDAAQSAGKINIDVRKSPIDLLALSAHKIYGPKGIGALYVRRKPRIRVAAQIHGGGQEQGMRSGTLAPHQIVGMGEAFRLAKIEMENDATKMEHYRSTLLQQVPHIQLHSEIDHTYPGIMNICYKDLTAEAFIKKFSELAVSAGSACLSKGIEPSYVLRAMGLSNEEAHRGVRVSFGKFTTLEEIQQLCSYLTT